jgi:hypothetical protein
LDCSARRQTVAREVTAERVCSFLDR